MPIRIYNSLRKTKEELKASDSRDKTIKMYCCGVTVYDECHIGHARSLYVFDMIRRYLQYRGFNVRFVRNITDLDDKIITKAKETNQDWKEIIAQNIDSYHRDLKSLRIDRADQEPRATENIPDMVRDIEGLLAKGYAYEVDGDIYFSVRKFPGYGKLSGQGIEKLEEAVRIEKDAKKKDPLDFALWKKSLPDEPSWPYWGGGRPGWHIECSCMSLKYLNCQTLDIHAGGRDLIFPHHENEIAQSEALWGKPFARYWIHHGLLTINGQKMAKSTGNFITVGDCLKKYTADELKMFFLFSHYASGMDFTEKKMEEAQKALERFDILFWKAYDIMKGKNSLGPFAADFVQQAQDRFLKAMDDDFNTPQALGCLFDLITLTNKFIEQEKDNQHYTGIIYNAVDTVESLAHEVFGLFSQEKEVAVTEEEQELLEERKRARANKDFKRSDQIRGLLKQKGIVVEDTPAGQSWRKI